MQKHISLETILAMEKQNRVHFVNSLGGFKSVSLVGTVDVFGNENLGIFSSILHIGANPPLMAMLFRPSPPERDTLKNILETGYFTINHINEKIYQQAHQTSARYDAAVSEFDATGLKSVYKDAFFAPYVSESNIQIGLQFKEKIEIQINNTTMIIGEINHIYFPDDCVSEDGFLNIEKANTMTCSGLDSYHKTLQIDRLSYAKPDKAITSLLQE